MVKTVTKYFAQEIEKWSNLMEHAKIVNFTLSQCYRNEGSVETLVMTEKRWPTTANVKHVPFILVHKIKTVIALQINVILMKRTFRMAHVKSVELEK